MQNSYKSKYLKYKMKYLNLKNKKLGGMEGAVGIHNPIFIEMMENTKRNIAKKYMIIVLYASSEEWKFIGTRKKFLEWFTARNFS